MLVSTLWGGGQDTFVSEHDLRSASLPASDHPHAAVTCLSWSPLASSMYPAKKQCYGRQTLQQSDHTGSLACLWVTAMCVCRVLCPISSQDVSDWFRSTPLLFAECSRRQNCVGTHFWWLRNTCVWNCWGTNLWVTTFFQQRTDSCKIMWPRESPAPYHAHRREKNIRFRKWVCLCIASWIFIFI